MKKEIRHLIFTILFLILPISGLLSACSKNPASDANNGEPAMASLEAMPPEVKSAPQRCSRLINSLRLILTC